MDRWRHFPVILFMAVLFVSGFSASAQIDTTKKLSIDSILLREKGIIGRLAQSLLTDTIAENNLVLLRTDKPFQRYQGRIIRNIKIQTVEFGRSIADTTWRLNNKLKKAFQYVSPADKRFSDQPKFILFQT